MIIPFEIDTYHMLCYSNITVYIHQHLNCEYHEYKNQGHFGGDYFKAEFPELTLSILNYLKHKNKK